MVKENVYERSEIAKNYSETLKKRMGLCLFDEKYLQRNIPKGSKVLDIGCGTGRHILKFGKMANISGIDISSKMIEITRENLEKNRIKSRLVVGNAQQVDKLFRREKFDIILMMYHTFGCIDSHKKRVLLLTKIRKLLDDEGLLILHVHNRNHIKNLKFLFNTYFNNKFEVGDRLIKKGDLKGAIIHFFSRREIKKLLKLTGFSIIDFINLRFPDEEKQLRYLSKYFYTGGFIVKAKNGI